MDHDLKSKSPNRLNLKSVWQLSKRVKKKCKNAKHQKVQQIRKQHNEQNKNCVWVCSLHHLPQTPPFLLPVIESHGDWSMGIERETEDHKLRKKGLDFWISSTRSPQTINCIITSHTQLSQKYFTDSKDKYIFCPEDGLTPFFSGLIKFLLHWPLNPNCVATETILLRIFTYFSLHYQSGVFSLQVSVS